MCPWGHPFAKILFRSLVGKRMSTGMLKMGRDFWAAQKYLCKILKNICCLGGVAQWGRWSWSYFWTNQIKGGCAHEGAVGQQLVRGDRKCFLLWAVTGVKGLSIDIEQDPYSVLHAKFSFYFCQRHLRAFLLSILCEHTHTHMNTVTCSLPSLPHIFEGFTYLCAFRTKTKTVLKTESIFRFLHYNFYLFCCSLLFSESSTQVLYLLKGIFLLRM